MYGKNKKEKVTKSNTVVNKKATYLFVISVEGEKTEPGYFRMFSDSPWIQLVVIKPKNGESSPEYILERLKDSIRPDGANHLDQYWFVCDVDDHSNLIETIQKIKTHNALKNSGNKIEIAISNPRFEVWLALHSSKIDVKIPKYIDLLKNDPESIIKEFAENYNKKIDQACKNYLFLRKVKAIENAEKLDSKKNEDIPISPGTRVYKLVKEILETIERRQ